MASVTTQIGPTSLSKCNSFSSLPPLAWIGKEEDERDPVSAGTSEDINRSVKDSKKEKKVIMPLSFSSVKEY